MGVSLAAHSKCSLCFSWRSLTTIPGEPKNYQVKHSRRKNKNVQIRRIKRDQPGKAACDYKITLGKNMLISEYQEEMVTSVAKKGQLLKWVWEEKEVVGRVGLSHCIPLSQSYGEVAHQLADISQSEDLFITDLNCVVNRKVMLLKKARWKPKKKRLIILLSLYFTVFTAPALLKWALYQISSP